MSRLSDSAERSRYEKSMHDIQTELGQSLQRMHEIREVIEPARIEKEKQTVSKILEAIVLKRAEEAKKQMLEYIRMDNEKEKVSQFLQAMLMEK
jgi:ribosomal protein L19